MKRMPARSGQEKSFVAEAEAGSDLCPSNPLLLFVAERCCCPDARPAPNSGEVLKRSSLESKDCCPKLVESQDGAAGKKRCNVSHCGWYGLSSALDSGH